MGARGSTIPVLPEVSSNNASNSFNDKHFFICCHAEPADAEDGTFRGLPWGLTADGLSWPKDPPLSDRGLREARHMAEELAQRCGSAELKLSVFSSPYRCCLETASKICSAFPGEHRLIIDQSLGEVLAPERFGETQHQPKDMTPLEHFLICCKVNKVICNASRGSWPIWPETAVSARRRLANRILKAVIEFCQGSTHVALVSHADCVAAGASLLLAPSGRGGRSLRVERVCHGAELHASQSREAFKVQNAEVAAGAFPGAAAVAAAHTQGEADTPKVRSMALRCLQLQSTRGVETEPWSQHLRQSCVPFVQDRYLNAKKVDNLLSQLPATAFRCQKSQLDLGDPSPDSSFEMRSPSLDSDDSSSSRSLGVFPGMPSFDHRHDDHASSSRSGAARQSVSGRSDLEPVTEVQSPEPSMSKHQLDDCAEGLAAEAVPPMEDIPPSSDAELDDLLS